MRCLRGSARPSFLSTPSARRATSCACFLVPGQIDFYPRPPRGGRQCTAYTSYYTIFISIHALREEGDLSFTGCYRGELTFLSTPSARRATMSLHSDLGLFLNFYPRPPRGGRPAAIRVDPLPANFYPRPPRGGRRRKHELKDSTRYISIHALREEGDASASNNCFGMKKFLSTPSARRAT